jgi:hypothetical protein
MHESLVTACSTYKAQLSRRLYATPRAFLDFLAAFSAGLAATRTARAARLRSLRDGVVKLQETNGTVQLVEVLLVGFHVYTLLLRS